MWLIARNRDRLNQTAEGCGIPAKVFSMDLGDTNAYFEYINALKENNPDVALLVNCSGFRQICGVLRHSDAGQSQHDRH